LAAACENEESLDYLISKGANINALTIGNETPIMKAILHGYEKLTKKLLLTYKCDVMVRNGLEKTIFDMILIYMGKDKLDYYICQLNKIYPRINFYNYYIHNDMVIEF